MANESDYKNMLKAFYENETPNMKIANHSEHNSNPDYWNILLAPLKEGDWSDKTTLDFGCGCGRNVLNILSNFNVKEAHGCDVSQNNINYCNEFVKNNYSGTNYKFYCNDANSLSPGESEKYDFIMSTIVLQHICVYDVRKSILRDMYRCLKKGGTLSIQMGFGMGHHNAADYYDNAYGATSTNSAHDVRVLDKNHLINDLAEIGFTNIETTLSHSWSDSHSQWIFAKSTK